MRFTPNDIVRVRFTKEGKMRVVAEIDKTNDRLRARHPPCLHRVAIPYDDNGEMESQFHMIMSVLGGYESRLGQDMLIEWIEPKVKQ